MKKLKTAFIIIAAIVILAFIVDFFQNENNESGKAEEPIKPALRTVTIDKSKLKMHQDGYSIGKDTELTELQKQLDNDTCDIIEITWIWDCSPKYPDMPMKLTFDKTSNSLKLIYTQNNVIEDYSNISSGCLSQFLKNGNKSFYTISDYCINSKYDFNNREMNN